MWQALFKASNGDQSRWSQVTYSVFWSEHITPHKCTGCLPFFAATDAQPLLPFDIIEANYLPPPLDSILSSINLVVRHAVTVAEILHAMTKQDESKVNCQEVSQSAQGRDKSCQTCQTLRSVLKRMSFVQGPVEVSCSGQERGVEEDNLDWYCVNCGVYIHAVLSTVLTKLLQSVQE